MTIWIIVDNVDHAKFAVCTKITTTGATSGAGFAYPSGVSEFTLILVRFALHNI
jgi:hypothetical protein